LKNGARRREASVLFHVFICVDELRRSGGALPFHHWKEGSVVERQLCASAAEISLAPLSVRCIDKLEEFNAIERDWNRLIERARVDPVFLSHAWLRTWWECFGANEEFRIISVWSGRQLVGAAPMMNRSASSYGVRLRQLQSVYNYHTPRFDFPVAERHIEVCREIWKELSRSDGEWDGVVLAQVPEDSPTLATLEALSAADGWLGGQWPAKPSPVIPLDCEYDTVMKRLSGKERYNLRKRFTRLCETGRVELEVVCTRDRVREVMPDVLRIEAAAWKGKNGTAIQSDDAVAEFYSRFAERAADLGWLRIYFLRLDDKRIALNYALLKDRILYAVKIGYDPTYHQCSPGHLLLQQVLQRACSERCKQYDFLGADDEWKYVWTQEVRPHRWLFLYRNRFWPRLVHGAKFEMLPRLKKALQTFHG
jgi:CelD/BcsL family acetyltransferase involved in cellulose biosynthesis